ncbi:MAG: hypothetical protein DMG42_09590 [Acidobacteria bacterium]|nr:MAG: hypothetical protein DMG42_09590 [Acidobacteriota bacterium]
MLDALSSFTEMTQDADDQNPPSDNHEIANNAPVFLSAEAKKQVSAVETNSIQNELRASISALSP